MNAVREHLAALNPSVTIFEVASTTGEGVDAWVQYLGARLEAKHSERP